MIRTPIKKPILFGMVDIVPGKVRYDFKALQRIKDFSIRELETSWFLQGTPFHSIVHLFLYGETLNLKIPRMAIHKKDKNLSTKQTLDMKVLQWADWENFDLLSDIFSIATLEALLQIGRKFNLPIEVFEKERRRYGQIPQTIEACKAYRAPYQRTTPQEWGEA